MPPVFMSHSFGSGRCSSRSKSDRRSDSITRALSSRWRYPLSTPSMLLRITTLRKTVPARLRRISRVAESSALFSSTLSTMNRMNSGETISRPAPISAKMNTARIA